MLAVRLRTDAPRADEVWAKIAGGDRSLQVEFLQMEMLMEADLVAAEECLEVLDGRFETYALRLGAARQYLLCDLDTRARQWTILELSSGSNLLAEAYREACAAHGLLSPSRERHGGK